MHNSNRIEEFNNLVNKKFSIYNSLFLNLPYRKDSNIGILIPILFNQCKEGLKNGLEPSAIMEAFFQSYTDISSEQDKIDFMFRVIQYVERQVVLYDSVEDAAFPKMLQLENSLAMKDLFQLAGDDKTKGNLIDKLSSFSARIVFTAHPTQFYAPSVLDIISHLRSLIPDNKINEIDQSLQQLGLTSLINAKKPTPLDEALHIIYFLRYVFYDATGELFTRIKEQVGNNDFQNYNIIQLGFWPGGDRDGNPFVTAEITANVADELRKNLMKCYYADVKQLRLQLTFRGIEDILSALLNRLYIALFDAANPLTFEEILTPLLNTRELVVHKFHRQYLKELDRLIDKVRIFRTHFATLDLRQDHSIHYQVVTAILIKEGLIAESLDELPKSELIDILLNSNFQLRAEDFEDELVKDTIINIAQLEAIQQKNGEAGCNRYIISHSEDVFAILFVYGLFRWCGWGNKPISFDIIPLFETMDDMEQAQQVMDDLYHIPAYRTHLKGRKDKQTVMLGFSDGTKDGGYLKANWSIFKAKEKLTAVSEKNQVKVLFFDGRGGPPARGGGKTHRFYAAQSQFIANHEIQLTIQGQTITSQYGTREQYIHNCEQLLTAGMSLHLPGRGNIISDENRSLIEGLSNIGFEKYSALKSHPRFLSYLENRSTLRYYSLTNIGSRPGKRGNKAKLELKDLRAISFVGSWSQLKQNVPGYFGTGTALKRLVQEGKTIALQQLFHDVPFFKALVLNSMMSLTKSNFNLTSYMQKDPEYSEFWKILYDEYLLTIDMLLLISGYKEMMEEEPISRESIRIRENIVLPLLVIQQFALQKINNNSDQTALYEKIVIRSLYGNINASRNSA